MTVDNTRQKKAILYCSESLFCTILQILQIPIVEKDRYNLVKSLSFNL